MVAQLTLPILCVGLLLLWASKTETSALSDLETDVDKCSWFKCPEKAEATEVTECPDDSSIRSDEEGDKSENDYHFQLVQTLSVLNQQNREKRDIASGYIDLLELCCGATERNSCSCNKCAEKTQCKPEQVLLELSQGNGKPGSCCSKYECGPEPTCDGGFDSIYWLDSCTKCHSCNLPRCTYVCNPMELSPPGNCLSDDNRAILNGDSWTQGDGCEKCICKDGNKQCITPYCKKPECENAIKMPGECCPSCPNPEPTPESTKAAKITPLTTTTTAFIVSTEGAIPLSSSTSTEISTMETTVEHATEFILEENTINENSLEDLLNAELTSTTSSSSISEEIEFGETTTTDSTNFSTQEDTTEQPDIDNTEIDSSSSSSSISIISSTSSPIEDPKTMATSAPAAQMPESTSWHRDFNIDDAEYRFASENHNNAVQQSNEQIIWMVIAICVIVAVLILVLLVQFGLKNMKQRKQRHSLYSSVPCSESNISEHTNISEKTNTTSDLLIVRIEQPYQKQQIQKETLE